MPKLMYSTISAAALLCAGGAVRQQPTAAGDARLFHYPSIHTKNRLRSSSWDDVWEKVATLEPRSDKWFGEIHSYQTMYKLMLERWHGKTVGPKFFEIGLGCNVGYGPGASVQAWQTILPNLDLWEAEYNEACLNKARNDGKLEGISTVAGDQGNSEVVASWAAQSGGNFDVVVDDGGHKNSQIKTSFDGLWPYVKKGGLYFVEDLQVGRRERFDDMEGHVVMSDILQSWVEQLLIEGASVKQQRFPMPEDIDYILCQKEACVIAKKP